MSSNIELHPRRTLERVFDLEPKIAQKIKTREELKAIIGDRPREKEVVMCHGTFDGLHPGHTRHLFFAKRHAPILVVTITTDKHITKGDLRPWTPEELRALHLASSEIVDFVAIDHNPTPIENIKYLKPDYFVKGAEYSQGGTINPKTQEEIDALKTYGGTMLFSPGDIVFSSTEILRHERPKFSLERILIYMEQNNISFKDLKETLRKISGLEITVIGDSIVDKYSICLPQVGQTQEEDVPSYLYDRSELFTGGAGVVAKHLKSLGAKINLITVTGKDGIGRQVIKDLEEYGVKLRVFEDPTRPTTIKERFISGENGRVLFKVNTLENRGLSDEMIKDLCSAVSELESQAIICSDFRHGIFDKFSTPRIIESIPPGMIKIADSQVSTRWGNILDFKGFDVITPNEREARWALGNQDSGVRPLAQELYNKSGCRYLMLKLGKDGLMTYISPGLESREYFYFETFASEVRSPIGAGDALLAASTGALVASRDILQASIIGSIAAGLECETLGNIPITTEQILEKIDVLEKTARQV